MYSFIHHFRYGFRYVFGMGIGMGLDDDMRLAYIGWWYEFINGFECWYEFGYEKMFQIMIRFKIIKHY